MNHQLAKRNVGNWKAIGECQSKYDCKLVRTSLATYCLPPYRGGQMCESISPLNLTIKLKSGKELNMCEHETLIEAKRYSPEEIVDEILTHGNWFEIADWEVADNKTLAGFWLELVFQYSQFEFNKELTDDENRIELIESLRDIMKDQISYLAEHENRMNNYDGIEK